MNQSPTLDLFVVLVVLLLAFFPAVLFVRFVVRPVMHWIDRASLWRMDREFEARRRRNARLHTADQMTVREIGSQQWR